MNRRILVFLAVLMVALSAWSQLLWRVSGNGLEKPSFLMGTHHFAPADFIDSVSGLNDAIRSCDAVYGEIHRDSMMNIQAQQRVAMAMVAPADSTLDKVLTPEQYAVVKSVVDGYLAPAGITLASLNMLKPAGVSIQLQALQALKYFKDFDHNKQIDRSVQNRGEQAGKMLGGFETVDDQVAILFGTPIVDQAEGLVDVCEHDADFERVCIELAEAYMRQDLDFMLRQIVTPDAGLAPTDAELELLLWGRNRRWVEKLKVLMPQQSVLVCVGAGHLPGDKGLIALLSGAGYIVESVSK